MASLQLPTHLNGIPLSSRSSWLLGAPIEMLMHPKVLPPIYHQRSPRLKSYLDSAKHAYEQRALWRTPPSDLMCGK